MTPDPADLAREPNADYWRGVREERERHSSQCEPHTCECHRRGVPQLNATDAGSECGACAEREGWRKAKEAALIAVDRHDDICDEDQLCYCPCAAKIESAIRNLPEEPERNAK